MPIHNVPIPLSPYILRTADEQLYKQFEAEEKACIEIVGSAGTGKTMLVQQLIHQHLNDTFKCYELIAWIDCSTVTRAHADLLTLSQRLQHPTQDPREAIWHLSDYCQQNPQHLLIFDALESDNLPFVTAELKSLPSQLIYTTRDTLISMFRSLGRVVHPIQLFPFKPSEAQQLVAQSLPDESFEGYDFSSLVAWTGGQPAVFQALCRHYQASTQYQDFKDLLAELPHPSSELDTVMGIVQTSLLPLENAAPSNAAINRALMILKQAAWLGDYPIPFAFFVDEEQKVDYEAIHMLYRRQLPCLTVDYKIESLRLIPVFRGALQKWYKAEQVQQIERNIGRLSKVFSYLTNNEAKECPRQPKDLMPYADLVYSLLFEIYTPGILTKDSPVLGQLLALGSSLGRLYYRYHGKLQLGYDSLQKALKFFKDNLSKACIAAFEQDPDKELMMPVLSKAEACLLTLYAKEYLYQIATLGSQLIPGNQATPEVIQDFQKAYAIQRNMKADPASIAYILRNLARALRKQGLLKPALHWYEVLRVWTSQHSFNALQTADLLFDEGIIKKGCEDRKPVEQRRYQDAIETLLKTYGMYEAHNASGQYCSHLATLSIYLGEAYLAAKDFESGITHTYRILHYDGEVRWKRARTYFNLAKAFHKAGYTALAKSYVEKAYPLQIAAYRADTEALSLDAEQALLAAHQQTPMTQSTDLPAEETGIDTDYEKALLINSQSPKRLSRDQIEKSNQYLYNQSYYQYCASTNQARQTALERKREILKSRTSEQTTQRNLKNEQQAFWYHEFEKWICLDDQKVKFFADQFEVALLMKMTHKIREVNQTVLPMDERDLGAELIHALSNALPIISAHTGIAIGTIDLPAILEGITQPLEDQHRLGQQITTLRALTLYQDPAQTKEHIIALGKCIQQQLQEMAHYAARCYQPLLSGFWGKNLTEEHIKTLADYGARRVMEYTHIACLETALHREFVIRALITGQSSTYLTRNPPRMSVNGFFSKPGVQVIAADSVLSTFYVRSQSRPSRYDFRFGSPTEVQHESYWGPFASESEAKTAVEEKVIPRCGVM